MLIKQSTMVSCNGKTKNNKPCGNKPIQGTQFCRLHVVETKPAEKKPEPKTKPAKKKLEPESEESNSESLESNSEESILISGSEEELEDESSELEDELEESEEEPPEESEEEDVITEEDYVYIVMVNGTPKEACSDEDYAKARAKTLKGSVVKVPFE